MTEYEKMHNGMIYDCLTEELGNVQKESHRLCEQYNKLGVDDDEEKQKILHKLFPKDNFGDYRAMEIPLKLVIMSLLVLIAHSQRVFIH